MHPMPIKEISNGERLFSVTTFGGRTQDQWSQVTLGLKRDSGFVYRKNWDMDHEVCITNQLYTPSEYGFLEHCLGSGLTLCPK